MSLPIQINAPLSPSRVQTFRRKSKKRYQFAVLGFFGYVCAQNNVPKKLFPYLFSKRTMNEPGRTEKLCTCSDVTKDILLADFFLYTPSFMLFKICKSVRNADMDLVRLPTFCNQCSLNHNFFPSYQRFFFVFK